ncbi:MAG: hypothetical protein WC346_05780 [Methanogenium sp.]|jgi:hypothetical protein
MADNVTVIPEATPINFYLGNYAYTDIVSDMKILQYRLDTAGSERIFYRNAAGTLFKIMTDASDGTNAPEGSIFFADSIGACKSSTNLLFSNETIKLNNLTASRVVIANADKELISSDITVTELNALDNISSNIQEQINALGQISGTAGYLAKFDGVDSLQDSILYEQDITHNIGIGTSDPQRPLHINNATPHIRLSDSNAASTSQATGGLEWYQQNTLLGSVYFNLNSLHIRNETVGGDILFYTTEAGNIPTQKMKITSDGLINITTCYNAGTDTDRFLVLDVTGNINYRTGTQVLSDIGAATLSLTATYIPKATSSSTLGNSSICENGSTSFVGINTATPLARLDIAEAREMAEAVTLCIGADLNNYTRTTNTRKISRFASVPYSLSEELTAILYTDNSSTYSHLKIGGGTSYMNAVTDIIFYTAEDITTATGTERVRIDSVGYVGIGTSDPQQPLHINRVTPSIRLSDSDAASTTASTGWIEWYWQTTRMGYVGFGSTSNNNFYIHNELDGDILFRTNNTLRMLIDSTGYVGIGEDDPGQILHITHASQPVIRLENSGALSREAMMGWIEFNYKAYRVGYIGYGLVGTDTLYINNEQPNGDIILYTGNQNSLSISSAGRIHTPRLATGTPVSRLALTSTHEIITIGNESYTSGTVTLKDGTTTRDTGTAYITKNEYTRICTVHLPSLSGTVTASTTTKLTFFTGAIVAPVDGATVIAAPLKSNSTDILGILWIKNDNTVELHTSNPWGYLAAGTGGIVETDFSYKY